VACAMVRPETKRDGRAVKLADRYVPLAVAHQRPVSAIGTAIRSYHWWEVRVNSLPVNIVPHNRPLRYSRPKGVPFGNYPAYSRSRHSDKRRVKPVRYRDSDKGRQQ
jgi:hypothetical protein